MVEFSKNLEKDIALIQFFFKKNVFLANKHYETEKRPPIYGEMGIFERLYKRTGSTYFLSVTSRRILIYNIRHFTYRSFLKIFYLWKT